MLHGLCCQTYVLIVQICENFSQRGSFSISEFLSKPSETRGLE